MLKRLFAAFFAAAICAAFVCGCTDVGKSGEVYPTDIYNEAEMSGTIIKTTFAGDVIPTAENLGITLDEYLHGNDKGGFSYEGNGARKEKSVIISPHYKLVVNGEDVPVYATIVHDGTTQSNVLTSFAMIEVKEKSGFSLKAELLPQSFGIKNAIVLPEAKKVAAEVSSSGSVCTVINEFGNFNFLVSQSRDADYSTDFARQHSFTLFVKEYVDEDAEIAAYIDEFGAENVTVFEPGFHEFSYINIDSDNQVLYFRRGCYMFSKGRDDYGEDNNYFEKHRGGDITWNLTRFPAINANGRNNIVIAGNGWIDGGGLGWHERRGILLSYCDGAVVKDITLINFPEWTLITYVSENIDIARCVIYGYKTNSDGFAICNSVNATVRNCFARSGDDLFEIKTLGGPDDAVADNVTFTDCTAWASKARCFGIIAETDRPISNITFRDCYVVYRDSTWDNDFLGSLMVYCESSKHAAKIDNILFENIEIYRDLGRAINVKMEDGKAAPTHVTNVTFRNVRYTAALNSLLYSPDGDYIQEVTLENVTANGTLMTEETNLALFWAMKGEGNIKVNEAAE